MGWIFWELLGNLGVLFGWTWIATKMIRPVTSRGSTFEFAYLWKPTIIERPSPSSLWFSIHLQSKCQTRSQVKLVPKELLFQMPTLEQDKVAPSSTSTTFLTVHLCTCSAGRRLWLLHQKIHGTNFGAYDFSHYFIPSHTIPSNAAKLQRIEQERKKWGGRHYTDILKLPGFPCVSFTPLYVLSLPCSFCLRDLVLYQHKLLAPCY